MDLQRQEYPSMLKTLEPNQAIKVLNGRLHHVRTINADVAEWLLERRRIEEQYAIALGKLSARPLSPDGLDMGIFTTPWQKIVSATESIANSHHVFARNIEAEVEKPLRHFATSSRELANMDNILGNIRVLASDVDNATKKAEKLREKGGKAAADKVASAATSVEDSRAQWDSQAPYVFERLQEVDELRLELLQKCLTQFQTFTDEVKNSSSDSVEACLNSLLNVQIADEIQHFSMKAPGSTTTQRERRMSRPQQPPTIPETSSLQPPPIALRGGNESQRSGSFQETPLHEKRSSKFGLKRLGTVMKGRRNSTHPYGQPLQSPEKKRSSTNLASKFPTFGKRSKDTPETLSPQVTGTSGPVERVPSGTPGPSETGPGSSLERVKSSQSVNAPSEKSRTTLEPPVLPSLVNGNHQAESPRISPRVSPRVSPRAVESPQPELNPSIPAPVAEESEKEQLEEAPLQGSDAITQAMNEAALVNDQPQFKVDIRNAPIQEEGDASAALTSVAQALRAQATPRRNPTLRGRRDRNSTIMPSPSVPELPSIAGAASTSTSSLPTSPVPPTREFTTPPPPVNPSPFKLSHRSTLETNDSAASDTHSIRSGRSLSSTVSTIVRHPDMHDDGLNASIVETVSAWFAGGECTRAIQIGEVALVYNSHDSSEPSGTETIKFNGFDTLEKVAPNPLFIDQVPKETGQYTINLSPIARTSVAFKYQVHLDPESPSSYAPIRVVPAWKVESNQTLLMLSYSLNPDFAPKLPEGATSITLNNVILIAHLQPGSGKVLRCQAAGGGVYARERNSVYWRLNEVKLTRDSPGQVHRARFFTEGDVQPGNAEARWELPGAQLSTLGSGIGLSRKEAWSASGSDSTDPFADESATPTPTVDWKEVNVVRRLRAGTYVASAT